MFGSDAETRGRGDAGTGDAGTRRGRRVRGRTGDGGSVMVVGGLRVGDDVRLGGFKVGRIRGVEAADLDSPEPKVHVTFALPAKYVLREDTKVGLQSTLTGSSNLNIADLGRGNPTPAGFIFSG